MPFYSLNATRRSSRITANGAQRWIGAHQFSSFSKLDRIVALAELYKLTKFGGSSSYSFFKKKNSKNFFYVKVPYLRQARQPKPEPDHRISRNILFWVDLFKETKFKLFEILFCFQILEIIQERRRGENVIRANDHLPVPRLLGHLVGGSKWLVRWTPAGHSAQHSSNIAH